MPSDRWPDNFRLPFGKYKGLQLDKVPLAYLDWLSGRDNLFADLRAALTKYLSDPAIKRELDKELGDAEAHQ